MHLKIITHEKIVFNEEVDEVYATGIDGEFGILKNHVPYMTALDIGITKAIKDGKTKYFTTMGGIFQFKNDEAQILTQTAECSDEIDEARAKEALNRAKTRLSENNAEIDAQRAQAALARALARLKVKLQ